MANFRSHLLVVNIDYEDLHEHLKKLDAHSSLADLIVNYIIDSNIGMDNVSMDELGQIVDITKNLFPDTTNAIEYIHARSVHLNPNIEKF